MSNNTNLIHPAAKFFNENGWVKVENFIDTNMANFLYYYVILAAKRAHYVEELQGDKFNQNQYGTFTDKQAMGDYSKYGDLVFDTLLDISLEQINKLTNRELISTYSYYRLYTKDTELKRHKDRPSCEISTTLCLGYNISNVDLKKYPNWNWPMFVADKENTKDGLPIHMKPGDMIIYKGCEIDHWREPFLGVNHAQVFLHYNEKDGKYNIPYDNRPLLGLSSDFKINNN